MHTTEYFTPASVEDTQPAGWYRLPEGDWERAAGPYATQDEAHGGEEHFLKTSTNADGTISFNVMMTAPGCFVGTIDSQGHIVAYLHRGYNADDEDTFVTCLDSDVDRGVYD